MSSQPSRLFMLAFLLVSVVLISGCFFGGDIEDEPNLQLSYDLGPSFDADPDGLGCYGVGKTAYNTDAMVEVTKLKDGHCYPSVQFHTPSKADQCPEIHYHYRVISITGFELQDSQPCASVKQSDIVKSGTIFVPSSKVREWNEKYEQYRQSVTGE